MAIRVAIGGAYALTEDDQRSLAMHFSGSAPASYLAAQQKADNLNLSARLLWDHNLLDLYRRLSAIPGARMGFKTGSEGTQIWLEIKRQDAAPALGAKVAAAPSDRRLKRGIEALGVVRGLRLYRFQYLGDARTFVGVMAQDLLADPRFAHAVIRRPSGLLMVDYAALGLAIPDFDAMRAAGEAAVVAYEMAAAA